MKVKKSKTLIKRRKMKKISILILAVISLFSCKKQKIPYPEKVQETTSLSMDNVYGNEYILESGVIYFENNSTGGITYYNHFDSLKLNSVLDPFYGAVIPFDSLKKNSTKWRFDSGVFTLNDTLHYQLEESMLGIKVFGLENGSARPIQLLRSTANSLDLQVFESQTTINNVDYRFYSQLHFRKVGSTANDNSYPIIFGATFNGVVPFSPTTPSSNLVGTRWVVTKYVTNLSTINTNDTLFFKTKSTYYVNSNSYRNYSLQYITSTGMYSLTLYDWSTVGGSYAGQLVNQFITDGQVNSLSMKNLYNQQTLLVWIKKI